MPVGAARLAARYRSARANHGVQVRPFDPAPFPIVERKQGPVGHHPVDHNLLVQELQDQV